MRLRSKTKVPIMSYVPKPPPAKPAKPTEAWKKQARTFARYFLVLFRPWGYEGSDGSLPGPLTWRSFCEYVRNLEEGIDGSGPSFLDVVRMQWIKTQVTDCAQVVLIEQLCKCSVEGMPLCRVFRTVHL